MQNEKSAITYSHAEGKVEGRIEGRAEGRQETLLATVRNAKAIGLTVEQIVQLTGLTVEEIEKIG